MSEGLPRICFECGRYGHVTAVCPMNNSKNHEPEAQAEMVAPMVVLLSQLVQLLHIFLNLELLSSPFSKLGN